MTSFKKVQSEDFKEIKKGLKKLYNVIEYSSNDHSVIENFDVAVLGSKFTISYYKTRTLLLQGDGKLDDFKIVVRFINHILGS
jgi:hypothetical protein